LSGQPISYGLSNVYGSRSLTRELYEASFVIKDGRIEIVNAARERTVILSDKFEYVGSNNIRMRVCVFIIDISLIIRPLIIVKVAFRSSSGMWRTIVNKDRRKT